MNFLGSKANIFRLNIADIAIADIADICNI